jgi:nucleoside-diphosphate-sugar epimerase
MKVVLTGVTGFIGHETLLQCLSNPTITSIIVLSRRALPASIPQDPKLKVITLEDFTNYPESIMSELSGAEACIW